jgi:hypothetical protein
MLQEFGAADSRSVAALLESFRNREKLAAQFLATENKQGLANPTTLHNEVCVMLHFARFVLAVHRSARIGATAAQVDVVQQRVKELEARMRNTKELATRHQTQRKCTAPQLGMLALLAELLLYADLLPASELMACYWLSLFLTLLCMLVLLAHACTDDSGLWRSMADVTEGLAAAMRDLKVAGTQLAAAGQSRKEVLNFLRVSSQAAAAVISVALCGPRREVLLALHKDSLTSVSYQHGTCVRRYSVCSARMLQSFTC